MLLVKVYGERGHNPEWEGRLSDFLRAHGCDTGLVDAVRGAWNSRDPSDDAAFDYNCQPGALSLVTIRRA